MTGDGTLRKKTLAEKMRVKGTLWVLDQLVAEDAISHADAGAALERMLESGSFLPRNECSIRMEKWTGR